MATAPKQSSVLSQVWPHEDQRCSADSDFGRRRIQSAERRVAGAAAGFPFEPSCLELERRLDNVGDWQMAICRNGLMALTWSPMWIARMMAMLAGRKPSRFWVLVFFFSPRLFSFYLRVPLMLLFLILRAHDEVVSSTCVHLLRRGPRRCKWQGV